MTQPKLTAWILGDQLVEFPTALDAAAEQTSREQIRVLLVESDARKAQLPYHRRKLVLLISAMRHFAEELRARGYRVDYVRADTFREGLRQHLDAWQPDKLITMQGAEYDMRRWQEGEMADELGVAVEVVPNTQFLVERYNPNPQPEPGKRYVMEGFYRDMRRHFDVLMEAKGEPTGGSWNYDKQNRQPLPKEALEMRVPVRFEPDAITREVMREVARNEHAVGKLDNFVLATTRAQAQQAFDDFIAHRFRDFGPYEDAMTSQHDILYHSMLSAYLNIGLLDPLDLVRRAEAVYREGNASTHLTPNSTVPINSVEGFVRQILGWREFMYWQYWRQMPGLRTANSWNHTRPMPQMFWDGETEMNCVKQVAGRVIENGYSHHIERLMIVTNFCMLAGIDPAAVNEWFWAFYVDAYEWVVTPNVIGMGLNADGGVIGTKPYVSSANYINKMSDYCQGCALQQTKRTGEGACPYNFLYWDFMMRNESKLRANPRVGRAVLGLYRFDEAERAAIQQQAQEFLEGLAYYEQG